MFLAFPVSLLLLGALINSCRSIIQYLLGTLDLSIEIHCKKFTVSHYLRYLKIAFIDCLFSLHPFCSLSFCFVSLPRYGCWRVNLSTYLHNKVCAVGSGSQAQTNERVGIRRSRLVGTQHSAPPRSSIVYSIEHHRVCCDEWSSWARQYSFIPTTPYIVFSGIYIHVCLLCTVLRIWSFGLCS